MSNQIHDAFAQVHASEPLKRRTMARVLSAAKPRRRSRTVPALCAALACVVLLLLGGYWVYDTPVCAISIDINPSVELGINRFDRVVRVEAFNEDGQLLTSTIHVKHMEYHQAVDALIQYCTQHISDPLVTLTVAAGSQSETEALCADLSAHASSAHCYSGSHEQAAEAHAHGLSLGKYRVYLELKAYDDTLEPETVQGLTMRSLYDLLEQYQAGTSGEAAPPESSSAPSASPTCSPDCQSTDCSGGSRQGYGQGTGDRPGAGNGQGSHGANHGQGAGTGQGQGQGGGHGARHGQTHE